MEIKLNLHATSAFHCRAYNSSVDDIRSILMDICRELSLHGEFIVSGFGQDRWPVDVGTDLPVFLEQLPALLRATYNGLEGIIDFYEQGVERSMVFEPINGGYMARCVSRTDWKPTHEVEFISTEDLQKILLTSRDEFLIATECVAPDLLNHIWVKEWVNGGAESPRIQ